MTSFGHFYKYRSVGLALMSGDSSRSRQFLIRFEFFESLPIPAISIFARKSALPVIGHRTYGAGQAIAVAQCAGEWTKCSSFIYTIHWFFALEYTFPVSVSDFQFPRVSSKHVFLQSTVRNLSRNRIVDIYTMMNYIDSKVDSNRLSAAFMWKMYALQKEGTLCDVTLKVRFSLSSLFLARSRSLTL